MLLVEWFAWWGEMSPIHADEQLDSYMVQMLGDPGWTLDRDLVLSAWRKLARREEIPNRKYTPEDGDRNDVHGQVRRVRDWLRMYYGGAISN